MISGIKVIDIKSIILALLLTNSFIFSQDDIFRLNVNNLNTSVNDSTHQFYFPSLLKRFLDDDTTLTSSDIFILNYGFAGTKFYDPYFNITLEDSIYKLNKAGLYSEAIDIGTKYLNMNPMSLMGNLQLAFAYKKTGNNNLEEKYYKRYLSVMESIEGWKPGNSLLKPFVLFNPKDSRKFLGYIGFNPVKQELITDKAGQHFEKVTAVFKNDSTIQKEFYFYIEIPYQKLSKKK